ncbi:MAG TPA: tetratricopeptide repeat protein, partial [Thermoanaerobaculia bacterium]|nr:tetratricopeptide repeat protein [Thermoanaerobaculia bacterium]
HPFGGHGRMKLRRFTLLIALAAVPIAAGYAGYSKPESAEAQLSFGSAVAKKGLWREAAFRFQPAVTKEPNIDRARNNLAVALEASGEYARALAEYKRALELDPNDNYIRRNYARFAEFYTSYTRTTGKATGAP